MHYLLKLKTNDGMFRNGRLPQVNIIRMKKKTNRNQETIVYVVYYKNVGICYHAFMIQVYILLFRNMCYYMERCSKIRVAIVQHILHCSAEKRVKPNSHLQIVLNLQVFRNTTYPFTKLFWNTKTFDTIHTSAMRNCRCIYI